YRLLYREGRSLEDARTAIAEAAGECAALGPLSDFIAVSNRGIVR
ncbi:MAG: acyl-[acyl-carrier-protein]--UDP-N-acetylglucosamine O-acyltransferase, partial [Rhodocyclaceae bacterium]|nr:acyl-[acyl-carrier-protein]--UDP-N-acetylglucosamine O-acyltransferase [Rhodocyclaceae bacterium]